MRLLVGATAVAVAVTVVAPPAPASDGDFLDAARRAAERVSFTGQVEVFWRDATGAHREELSIEDSSGSLLVRGATSVMAIPGHERLVRHGGEWNLLWPAGLKTDVRPDPARKYQITSTGAGVVAGRPTQIHEVRQAGSLRELIHIDAATGLLLRRDRFDGAGNVDRSVVFEAITVDGPAQPPARPAKLSDRTPKAIPASLADSRAMPELAGAYRRLGAYRQSGVIHLLYSDGLYDLSLFEQPGRLDRSALPAGGQAVNVAGARGWSYAWPGGHWLVWQAGPTVFTIVSDAPADQLLQAAASVRPGEGHPPSLLTRLRHAVRALVAPFSD